MSPDENVRNIINALGAVSEMSLMFYRDALHAGATYEEAIKLTQAFIAACIFGGAGNEKSEAGS